MRKREYRIIRKISSGGQCDVYEVKQVGTQKRFAAKVPKPDQQGIPGVRKYFLREAEHYQRLHYPNPHPNIIRMFDGNLSGHRDFLLLELMDATLEDVLARGMKDVEKTRAVTDVARGLEHIHAHGIYHRDLKLSNILRAHDGRFVLSDLGIASEAGPGLNRTQLSLGTPDLMAPEQHGPYYHADARTDIYGLGVCIHKLFLGEYPKGGINPSSGDAEVALGEGHKDLDDDFYLFLWRCLEPGAENRFQTMTELRKEWERLASEEILSTPPKRIFLGLTAGDLAGAAFVGLLGVGIALAGAKGR